MSTTSEDTASDDLSAVDVARMRANKHVESYAVLRAGAVVETLERTATLNGALEAGTRGKVQEVMVAPNGRATARVHFEHDNDRIPFVDVVVRPSSIKVVAGP